MNEPTNTPTQEIPVEVEVLDKPSYYPNNLYAYVHPSWLTNGIPHTVMKGASPGALIKQATSYDADDAEANDAPQLVAKYEFVGFVQVTTKVEEVKVKK